ncbi:hypothetical protein EUGRSUZ_H03194 [Eucalyptus grandis]|uniref:Uncharacterized protein n=2 Tax=Eucalyptus grandis TaxID=71139 RepID=A0ACC3JTV7_EUCGR|nr:hypothetical protein EUGRSUZ_H03194 [Eucalyptus grandis]
MPTRSSTECVYNTHKSHVCLAETVAPFVHILLVFMSHCHDSSLLSFIMVTFMRMVCFAFIVVVTDGGLP